MHVRWYRCDHEGAKQRDRAEQRIPTIGHTADEHVSVRGPCRHGIEERHAGAPELVANDYLIPGATRIVADSHVQPTVHKPSVKAVEVRTGYDQPFALGR
jgi:hypothetical protein